MSYDDFMPERGQRSPVITHLGLKRFADRPPKPTARETLMRYSSAHGCERRLCYDAVGFSQTDPMGIGDAGAAYFGTLIHEDTQNAIAALFPGAVAEHASEDAAHLISGSADELIPVADLEAVTHDEYPGTHVLWELKTMGEYAFDKQVGFNRRTNTRREGTGPAPKAIAQAGMNALNIERENPGVTIHFVVMGSICQAPLSVSKARAMGVEGVDRAVAEYWLPRYVWEPLALDEIDRMVLLAQMVDDGYVSDRVAIDDDGETRILLDPLATRKPWQCDYCPFEMLCASDGPGVIRITESRGLEQS